MESPKGARKVVLVCWGLAVLVVSFGFPPWKAGQTFRGFHPIWNPPYPVSGIDVSTMAALIVGMSIPAAVLYLVIGRSAIRSPIVSRKTWFVIGALIAVAAVVALVATLLIPYLSQRAREERIAEIGDLAAQYEIKKLPNEWPLKEKLIGRFAGASTVTRRKSQSLARAINDRLDSLRLMFREASIRDAAGLDPWKSSFVVRRYISPCDPDFVADRLYINMSYLTLVTELLTGDVRGRIDTSRVRQFSRILDSLRVATTLVDASRGDSELRGIYLHRILALVETAEKELETPFWETLLGSDQTQVNKARQLGVRLCD